MAVRDRVGQFRALALRALEDLFDQQDPFGRLALVQVLMIAGDTLVTISLAGSLFFSISPHEAKGKVLLYLVLTLAPFAVVSPFLGPLIDKSRGARRAMVVFSALGRAAICPLMATDTHSLLLFPEAFAILVLSKLYLVTRGALVPEMAAVAGSRQVRPPGGGWSAGSGAGTGTGVGAYELPVDPGAQADPGEEVAPGPGAGLESLAEEAAEEGQLDLFTQSPGPPATRAGQGGKEASNPGAAPDAGQAAMPLHRVEFAAFNARLTLLGTLAGFVGSVPAVIILKLAGAPGVLVLDTFVFVAAAVAGFRLPVRHWRRAGAGEADGEAAAASAGSAGSVPGGRADDDEQADRARAAADSHEGWSNAADRDLADLQPVAHPEVMFGLTTMSFIRGLSGFLIFLMAFGLRREKAGLEWYGLALSATGVGALIGLAVVGRLRQRLIEQQILLGSIWLIAVAALGAAFWHQLPAQVMLALVAGTAGAMAQPSFDALTQRFVPPAAQGRAFARFATRQQLVWCLGAILPVIIDFSFPVGDVFMAVVGGVVGLFYVTSRQALRYRALPRQHREAR